MEDCQWAEQDSNLRRLPPADLQSAPFAARDTDPYRIFKVSCLKAGREFPQSRRWDLNP